MMQTQAYTFQGRIHQQGRRLRIFMEQKLNIVRQSVTSVRRENLILCDSKHGPQLWKRARAPVNLQMKPGKKGISLSKEQAEKLLQGMDSLTEALSQQQDVSIDLAPK